MDILNKKKQQTKLEIKEAEKQMLALDFLAQYDKITLSLLKRDYLTSIDKFDFSLLDTNIPNSQNTVGFSLKAFKYYDDSKNDLISQNVEKFLTAFKADYSKELVLSLIGKEKEAPSINLYAVGNLNKPAFDSSYKNDVSEYGKFFERVYKSNFPGVEIVRLEHKNYDTDIRSYIRDSSTKYSGILLGIPGIKKTDKGVFLQGIERIADALNGYDFRLQVIAEPMSLDQTRKNINNILDLKNSLGAFLKEMKSESYSKSITETITKTIGVNASHSAAKTITNLAIGGALQAAAPIIGAAVGSIVPGLGTAIGAAVGTAIAAGAMATGSSLFKSTTSTNSGGINASLSKSDSESISKTAGVMRERINYAVEYTLKLLDEHLERLKQAESYGYWNVGVYIFAKDENTYNFVKNIAIAQFSGDVSHLEPVRAIDFCEDNNDEKYREYKAYIANAKNPIFKIFKDLNSENKKVFQSEHHPFGACYDGVTTPVTTPELSMYFAPPQRENVSVKVTKYGTFSGSIPQVDTDSINIGEFLYFGEGSNNKMISIPVSELTRHMFVCGITGSGKTNTLHSICSQVAKKNIKFLVVEPTVKTEYRDLPNVDIYSLGTEGENLAKNEICGARFRINPFYFPKGCSLLRHIDGLKAAFNSAFPMYSAMPYILESAINKVYTNLGWDLSSNSNKHCEDPWEDKSGLFFPTLENLYNIIDEVVNEVGYDVRLQMDMTGALKARIRSLLVGSKGAMLNTQNSIPIQDLIDNNVILEMRHMGNDEEKVFLMGLILNNIYEYASLQPLEHGKLKKLIVIEEAHRLFRNAEKNDNPEIANIRGAAIEQFSNMLAEMRAMGYGFVIVDQIPSKMLPDVIKNTATKIVHQLSSLDDRNAIGDTMTLGDAEKGDLPKLKCGECSIYTNGWNRAILCMASKFEEPTSNNVSSVKTRLEGKYAELFKTKVKVVDVYSVSSMILAMLSKDSNVFSKTLEKLQNEMSENQVKAILHSAIGESISIMNFSRIQKDFPAKIPTAHNAIKKVFDACVKEYSQDYKFYQRQYLDKILIRDNKMDLATKIGKYYEGDEAYRYLHSEISKYVAVYAKFIDDEIRREIEYTVAESIFRNSFFNSEMIIRKYSDFVEERRGLL